jgi:soluble lytic murein transglycosylase-like protein
MISLHFIFSIAKTYSISPLLLIAICNTESNFRNVINVNDGGSASYGVCQVKLATARFIERREVAPSELLNPSVNLTIAAKYLAYQTRRYGDKETDCIVSAYNAGSCLKNKEGKILNHIYLSKVYSHLEKNLMTDEVVYGRY